MKKLKLSLIFLSIFAAQAADSSNLENASADLARLSSPNSKAEQSNEVPSINPLFCEDEWNNIQMGLAIINDRIRQKQETLDYLKSNQPLIAKQMYCVGDLGDVPVADSNRSDENAGITAYCSYCRSSDRCENF